MNKRSKGNLHKYHAVHPDPHDGFPSIADDLKSHSRVQEELSRFFQDIQKLNSSISSSHEKPNDRFH